RRGSPLRVRTLETEPSLATWTSRTTSPERWAATAAGGYWGSIWLRRRASACAGATQTLWDEAVLVGANFVGAIFVEAISVVDDASMMALLSCLMEAGLVGLISARSRFAWSGFAGAGLMRKMTLPLS